MSASGGISSTALLPKQLLSVAPGRKPPRPEDILGRRRHMDRPGVTAAPAGIIRAARWMFPLSPCAAKLEPWPSSLMEQRIPGHPALGYCPAAARLRAA